FATTRAPAHSWTASSSATAAYDLSASAYVTVVPMVSRMVRDQHLLAAPVDGAMGQHYVVGHLEQDTVAASDRIDSMPLANLGFDLYVEPFISRGRFNSYRDVVAPRAARYADRFADLEPTRMDGAMSFDLDGDGSGDATLGDPQFTFTSIRSTTALRWDF